MYASEDQICQFCQQRGYKHCIKVSPNAYPGTSANGVSYQEAERRVNSLNFIAGVDAPFLPLIHQILQACTPVIKSGQTIEGTPSRNALNCVVLAWKSRQLTSAEYKEKASSYISRACGSLNFAIEAGHVECSSVFSSHLLAWVAYSTCSEEAAAPLHFKRSLAFLTCISDQSQAKAKPLPDILTIYGPFIIDCANAWAARHGTLPNRRTKFSQRVKYFDELRRTDEAGTWHCGIVEAANSTLGNLMEVALTWVYNISIREAEFNVSRGNVNDVLQYIRSELGDLDLYTGLKTIYAAFQGAHTNHTTVEGQLITRLFHRLRCILLLLTLLEADSVELGVLTPKTNFIATSVIRYCRTQAIRRGGPIEDYYLISWHNFGHLLVGGIALPIHECIERKIPSACFVNIVVCAWVVAELEFIGKEECARTLERYWRDRNIEDLRQILKFAQFPESMAED